MDVTESRTASSVAGSVELFEMVDRCGAHPDAQLGGTGARQLLGVEPQVEAWAELFARRDVIVVASVSCIYGLGAPEEYRNLCVFLEVGQKRPRQQLLDDLLAIQYERNDIEFVPGHFRVRGDTVEIFPAYLETAIRVELFGDEIEKIRSGEPTADEMNDTKSFIAGMPAWGTLIALTRFGGYSDTVIVPAEHAFRFPDDLSDAEAAARDVVIIAGHDAVALGVGHGTVAITIICRCGAFAIIRVIARLDVARHLEDDGVLCTAALARVPLRRIAAGRRRSHAAHARALLSSFEAQREHFVAVACALRAGALDIYVLMMVAVAGAIAGVIREHHRAEVQAIGAGAVNQAIKALVLATGYLKNDGIDITCVPEFADVAIDDKVRTAIKLVIEPRK